MADNNWKQQQAKARDLDRILSAIEAYIDEHGYSPTKDEIAEVAGIPNSTTRRHIQALLADGRLTEGKGARTLRLAD